MKESNFCSHCCEVVELESTIEYPQQCPECGSYIVACSACQGGVCSKCKVNKKANRLNSRNED